MYIVSITVYIARNRVVYYIVSSTVNIVINRVVYL